MWKTILEVAPPVLQAVSVAVTAIFAVWGLRAWRRQLIGKRRIEIAEDALLASYKARGALSHIRNAMSFAGEGATRPRGSSESEAVAEAKDTYFVQLKRIQETSDDFAELEKMRLLCQVHFGQGATKPFDALLQARHRVAVAARMLVDMVGEHVADRAFLEQLKADIWEGYGSEGKPDDDAIAKLVTAAIADVEALCRPHLKV